MTKPLKTVILYSSLQQLKEHFNGTRDWYYLNYKSGNLAMEGTWDFIHEYLEEKRSQGIRVSIQLEELNK